MIGSADGGVLAGGQAAADFARSMKQGRLRGLVS